MYLSFILLKYIKDNLKLIDSIDLRLSDFRMKILIILHKAKKKGGAVLQILKMAKAIKNQGNEVLIFSIDSIVKTNNILYNQIRIILALKKEIKKFNPDVILSSEPIITTLYTLLARTKKIPIVVRIGAVYDSFYAARLMERISSEKLINPLFYFFKKLLRFYSSIVFKKIDLVVFNSHFLKNIYNNIAPHSIVIHNGVEIIKVKELLVKQPLKFVYLGRIEPRKSIELIINSLGIVKSKQNEFTLNIIGNTLMYPYYWKKIVNLISSNKITNEVKIVGEIENQLLAKELQKYDVLLFSTDSRNFPITEGLPNVVLEGMSCGLAIIATSVAGLPEIINKDNGFLVEMNTSDFVEKMIHLIDHPETVLAMKKANIHDIRERFSINKTIEKYNQIFIQLSKNKNQ